MSGCLNKLGSQLNIKEKDKTREIKKKKYIFLKQATWPPILAHCALLNNCLKWNKMAPKQWDLDFLPCQPGEQGDLITF